METKFKFDEWLIFGLFWFLVVLVLGQVFSRYLMKTSISWTEEVARYTLISLTFLGLLSGARNKAHISVEFLFRYLPDSVARILHLIADLVCVVFSIGMTVLALSLFQLAKGQRMSTLPVDRNVLYFIVMLGFLFLSAHYLQSFIVSWFGRSKK
jgi:TRAP-type C4-dicarboxylate transport system permease small subunit